jgi:alpha-L-arabinofuranosidase
MVICALSPLPVRVAITRFQFGAIVGKGRRSASEYSSCGSIAMTNLSPLVNTRGPIFTHTEGIVLRPVYHRCDLYRSQPAGEVLDAYVRMPSFEAEITSERIGPLPWGDAVATLDRPAGTLALSLANLHPAEPLERVIWVPGRTGPAVDADGRLARGLQRHLPFGRRQHFANFGRGDR